MIGQNVFLTGLLGVMFIFVIIKFYHGIMSFNFKVLIGAVLVASWLLIPVGGLMWIWGA